MGERRRTARPRSCCGGKDELRAFIDAGDMERLGALRRLVGDATATRSSRSARRAGTTAASSAPSSPSRTSTPTGGWTATWSAARPRSLPRSARGMHAELLAGTPSEPVLLGSECRALRHRQLPAPGRLPALHVDRRRASAGSPAAARCGAGRSSASGRSPRPTPGPEEFEPYGVGYVELPGEVRVEARLTESDPDELRIGMAMELTLIPAPGRRHGHVRVPAAGGAMSDDVAIVGLGIHPFGRHPGVSGLEMAAHAARAALADAGLGWEEIDFAAGGSDAAGNADTTVSALGLTGVPFINVKNGCATGGSALTTAHAMLTAGSAEIALVVGFDKHPPGAFNPLPEEWGIGSWYGETGLMLTTQFFAMKIQRYMAEHGISESTLAKVAAKAFENGALQPERVAPPAARPRRRCSPRKMVNDPLRQYMFCSPGEGAVALVLARGERARELAPTPVYLRSVGVPHAPLRLVRGLQPVDPGRDGAVADRRGGRGGVRAGRHRPRGRRRRPAPGHRVRRRDHAPRRDRPLRSDGEQEQLIQSGATRDRRPPAGQHRRRLPRQRRADRRLRPAPGARGRAPAARRGRRAPGPRARAGRLHPGLRRPRRQRLHGAEHLTPGFR